MYFEIVWPMQRTVSDAEIEQWFIDAILDGRVSTHHVRWRHDAAAMARILECAGIIHLKVNNSCDTTERRKDITS